MVATFEEWRADVGTVFVQHIDDALGALFGRHATCVHAPTCGQALAMEHTGEVYSCDHYVEPGYQLGHATDGFQRLLASPQQRAFGHAKAELTMQCLACPVRWACHGGCPKDRFALSRDGQPGHNYLCAGYEQFFGHAEPYLRHMAAAIMRGELPAGQGHSGQE